MRDVNVMVLISTNFSHSVIVHINKTIVQALDFQMQNKTFVETSYFRLQINQLNLKRLD